MDSVTSGIVQGTRRSCEYAPELGRRKVRQLRRHEMNPTLGSTDKTTSSYYAVSFRVRSCLAHLFHGMKNTFDQSSPEYPQAPPSRFYPFRGLRNKIHTYNEGTSVIAPLGSVRRPICPVTVWDGPVRVLTCIK